MVDCSVMCIVDLPGPSYNHEGTKICRRGHLGDYRWQLQGRGPAYILVIHRLVVINTEPIVLAASRTTRVGLMTWSHIICGIKCNGTSRAFRKVEITCILVACTSLGVLMTRSRSGVRVNPLQRGGWQPWFIIGKPGAQSVKTGAGIHHCMYSIKTAQRGWPGTPQSINLPEST